MNRLFGKASDVMLGLLAPKAEAEAAWIGCCDFRICQFRRPTGQVNCVHCSDPRC